MSNKNGSQGFWSKSDFTQRGSVAWKTSGYTGSCLKVCSLVLLPLWIAMIVVGSIYLHQCALDDKIPIWLIVYGSAALLGQVFDVMSFVWDCIVNKDKKLAERTHGNLFDIFAGLIGLFIFIWLIVGSVWLFAPYAQYNQAGRPNCSVFPTSPLCCERPVYLFAFGMAIFGWASIALVLVMFCIAVCVGCCCVGAVLAGYSAV